MTRPNPILLMTRTPDASDRFYRQLPPDLRARLDLCVSPLIGIEEVGGEIDVADARGVVFTSSNGVLVASRRSARRDLPAFCVGQATTDAAKAAGWHARCLGASAEEFVPALLAEQVEAPLLHLSGTHTRGGVAERLTEGGCPTRGQAIYDQVLLPLTDEATVLLQSGRAVIVPIFSPRTARHFADQCPKTANPCLIALSAAVAAPLAGLSAWQPLVADRPDADSMAACVQSSADRFCRVERSGGAQ
ncbi:uroporphyrinogen-III synthase [Sedimentitalea arenosa]|uniref:Uroporphyrinogen-III synthase n=1 Tax=Sedimentitalea arenosa TaxID=2798803 RepID=A0A8J7LRM9_9RHOB|nr:uroporphyrinogen-III synthase [Arenibacterium arenosum]MBJ6372013.1 uroporphyrinogen-III synthase [Arenibacterium arenosum]